MAKDWFPFFSMLFWCATKLVGLSLFVTGLIGLGTLIGGFTFWRLILIVAVPLVIGYLLLSTEYFFDLATAEQRRRQSSAK